MLHLFWIYHSDLTPSTLAQCHICALVSHVSSFMSQHYFKFSVLKCGFMSQSLISWKWVVALQLPFKEPFHPDFISYCFCCMKNKIFLSLSLWEYNKQSFCATGIVFVVINTNSIFSYIQVTSQFSTVLSCCTEFHLSFQISPSTSLSQSTTPPFTLASSFDPILKTTNPYMLDKNSSWKMLFYGVFFHLIWNASFHSWNVMKISDSKFKDNVLHLE